MENLNVSTTWIENLALEEINMEESGVINFDDHLNPEHHLEESSIEFMEAIREKFEIYLSKFNQYRSNGENSNTIKLFKISNTVNDFMLYRNTLKLVVARKSNSAISIGFLASSGKLFSARVNLEDSILNNIHEIKAHIGVFNDIKWKFRGEDLDIDSLTKHYLTEFIKHSSK